MKDPVTQTAKNEGCGFPWAVLIDEHMNFSDAHFLYQMVRAKDGGWAPMGTTQHPRSSMKMSLVIIGGWRTDDLMKAWWGFSCTLKPSFLILKILQSAKIP